MDTLQKIYQTSSVFIWNILIDIDLRLLHHTWILDIRLWFSVYNIWFIVTYWDTSWIM